MRLKQLRLGVGAVVLCGIAASPACAQRDRVALERTRIDTTIPFNASGTLELELSAGEIRVNAWTRNEARIVATTDGGEISAVLSPLRIELEARRSRGGTRYTLTVPIGVTVTAATVSGSVIVNGTRGPVELETRSGHIEASEVTGRVHIEAASGRVMLQRVSGSTTVEVLTGSVSITEIEGDLEIDAIGGSSKVERGNLRRLVFESVGGSFDFSGELGATGPHSIETHSGNITLSLPANFAATLDLETFSGELRPTDFPLVTLPRTARGRESDRMRFTINGGGAPLSITTYSGDILLRRLGATPQEH